MGPEKNTSQPPPPHLNRQKPPLPPHLNPQQQQQPPRQQVQIYHILPPKVYHTDAANFKSLVQRLTGLNSHTPSPPSTPPSTFDAPRGESLSPALRVAATENANRAVQRLKTPSGILSPGPSFSPPSITPDFFQDFLYPSAIIEEELRDRQIQHRDEPLISSISDDDNPSKRPRFEFGGNDMHNYLSQDEDLYPQNMQTPFNGVGMGGNNVMMPPSSSTGDFMSGPSGTMPPHFMPFEEDNLFNDGVGMGNNNTMMMPPSSSMSMGDLMSGPSVTMPQDFMPFEEDNLFNEGVGMGTNNTMMIIPPSSSMSICDLMSGNSGVMPPDFMPFEEVNLFNDGVGIGGNNALTWHNGQQDLIGMSGDSGVMPQDMPGPSMSMGGNNAMMIPGSSMSMNELMNWHNGQQDLIGKPRRKLFPLPQGPFSNTLFVEGFPSDCSEREVAHVFRHFYGFKEVRVIVMTDYSKQTNVDPPVVCLAEFESPVSAACAFAALQGYQMDVNEHDSKFLQIQFF